MDNDIELGFDYDQRIEQLKDDLKKCFIDLCHQSDNIILFPQEEYNNFDDQFFAFEIYTPNLNPNNNNTIQCQFKSLCEFYISKRQIQPIDGNRIIDVVVKSDKIFKPDGDMTKFTVKIKFAID